MERISPYENIIQLAYSERGLDVNTA